ncbi:MAG: aspartate/glutamate racemase family protein [Bacillota bacterium]|nr:aspartate/glutamate racemase family protein [Bacillota bacterium]
MSAVTGEHGQFPMDHAAKLGIIRVITSRDQAFLETHGRLIEQAYAAVRTVSLCLPDQPDGVHDESTEQTAAAKMPDAARELAGRGVDAIVVSCCSDPGVREAAAAVDVPLVGAGEAAALVSLVYGGPVGVIGLTGQAPRTMCDVLGDRLVASIAPRGVRTTLDLLRPEAVSACEEAARWLLAQGAGVICLACTGTATIGLPRRLTEVLGVPVVDPVLAAGGLALMMVAQRHK